MADKHKLSSLQEQELEILKEFQRICNANNLQYFVVAGTMLGAMRHHGFIPWDDDIDVAMPRRDYDKFLEIAPKMLASDYYLETPREREHVTIVSTITSKKGGFTLNNAQKTLHTGAWIDIMMIDGVPDPGIKRMIHWYRYMALRALYQISHFDEVVDQNRKRPAYEKAIIKFAQITKLQKLLDSSKINARIEKLMRSVAYEESNYVATYCGIYRKNEIVPKEWYGKGIKFSFEDTEVFGLSKADKYLTQLYGDYMTPVQNKERSHVADMTADTNHAAGIDKITGNSPE